jgi:PIN domain nuclease of toxin-antitoxin system
VRLLLDTHTLVWAVVFPDRVPSSIRRLLLNSRNEVLASAVNFFELAAMNAAGRRRSPGVSAEAALGLTREAGYAILAVQPEHAVAVETIAPAHGDPFDRLLLAQAQIEGLQLVTHDEALAVYDSRTILF